MYASAIRKQRWQEDIVAARKNPLFTDTNCFVIFSAMQNNTIRLVTAVALAILCAASYLWMDLPVTDFLLATRPPLLTAIFKQITRLGESQWYLAGGLLVWLNFRKKDDRKASQGLLLFSSVAISGITANILKSLLGRARPRLYIHEQIYGFDFFHIDYAWLSFPSGHSATALGAASVLALCFPRLRIPFYAAGILIALSRVILTQHYLSDIIAGSILGLATTIILYQHSFRKKIHAA